MMGSMIIGILHPGSMGSGLGAQAAGSAVWASEGRSAATRQRAVDAGFEDVGTLPEIVERADVLISVCPPGAALDLARQVAGIGFDGLYVDANAVSPGTVREIGSLFRRFVDGGIVGPPPIRPGLTRLYVCGDEAGTIAAVFEGSLVEVIRVEGAVGSASAVKVCYASWTKGTSALLLAIRALAREEGVEDHLISEWRISIPELPERSDGAAGGAGPKAWRFVGEMKEISAAFESAGLPGGFHAAAADVYERLASLRDLPGVSIDDVVALLERGIGRSSP
jgi:hypothetical protein